MRTKFLTLMIAVGMLMSIAGIATAHHQPEHTQNHHGMCTAYFSGSENGQDKKRENGSAFGTFEETVGDQDDDGDVDSYDVAYFCDQTTGGFGNPGQGNDPSFGDDTCGFEDDVCQDLEDHEGGTGDDGNNGNDNPPGKG